MATKKKLLQAAAGAAGGAGGLNVEQVFSTYLYEGNGDTQVIENGINLGQSYGSGSISVPRGEDNNVTTSTNSDFAYGTGDFTWEAWIMPQVDDGTLNNSNRYIFDHGSGNLGGMSYYNGVLRYYNSTTNAQDSTQALTNYTWAHIAACRSSGTTKVFYNGTQILSFSDSYNFTATSFVIGDYGGSGGTYSFGGLYSDVRVSNTARYTSNFTPPTSSFSSDSNTVLLAGQGSTIVDNSSNALTLTANGDAVGKSFGYYDAADAGEGGLVWIKNRTLGTWHILFDSDRGAEKVLHTNETDAQANRSDTLTSFNASGFTLGAGGTGNANSVNATSSDYASWTFRKAPKFFDVVTWTGDGNTTQQIAHNLGVEPAVIIAKRTDSGNWFWPIYHRKLNGGVNPEDYYLSFSTNAEAADNAESWGSTAPTSTHFTVGNGGTVNASGATYVAYLFAHNDGDGDFGPDGDADIIKCGSFTEVNGSDVKVTLGFEPQWIMIKVTSSTGGWGMYDVMRGWTSGSDDFALSANTSNAESNVGDRWLINPNGFTWKNTGQARDIIYIAIRRGPMAVPTDATDVFAMQDGRLSTVPQFESGFVVDMAINRYTPSSTNPNEINARLTGNQTLSTNATSSEVTRTNVSFDFMDGYYEQATPATADHFAWMWKRAPSFCDVVAYTGNGTAGRTVSHNLGVAPEMMWVKKRDQAENWLVYHSATGNTKSLRLNSTTAAYTDTNWNDTTPTDSVFSLGSNGVVNYSGHKFIAYLFASLAGVSKVGSYTGNGTSTGDAQNIDCGFSSGARFVLIKAVSVAYSWMLFDTERGITSGNDSLLVLNDTNAETTAFDSVDPYSSGFTAVQGPYNMNQNGVEYIFYAIA